MELKTAGVTIEEQNRELAVRLDWVHDIEAQLERARNEIARLNQENIERTQWAQSLDAELQTRKIRPRATRSATANDRGVEMGTSREDSGALALSSIFVATRCRPMKNLLLRLARALSR